MDQILNAHIVHFASHLCPSKSDCDIVFDITANFAPISIKDQVIRASLIVERAVESGLITKGVAKDSESPGKQTGEARPLLVIGGGIAGIIACYHATKHNIKTYLVERLKLPLNKYKLFGNRLVIPNQYDWPLPHWSEKKFPFTECDSVFIRLEEFSLGEFQQFFQNFWETVEDSDLNTLCDSNEVKKIYFEPPTVANDFAFARMELKNKIDEELPPFGMILICTGFESEKTLVKGVNHEGKEEGVFVGMPFWNLESEHIDEIRITKAKKNILICGGGDGALQDFLLFVTGKDSVMAIYEKLRSNLPSDYQQNLIDCERKISDAEIYARQTELWLGNSRDKGTIDYFNQRLHSTYKQLHEKHCEAVSELISNSALREIIWESLGEMVDPFFEDFGNLITVAFWCNHFSKCYAFNRFLTLLIARYIEDKWSEKYREHGLIGVLCPDTDITGIEAVSPHKCANKVSDKEFENEEKYIEACNQMIDQAENCFNHRHQAWYMEKNCLSDKEDKKRLPGGPFEPVLIRFGINFPKLSFDGVKEPFYTTQLLPLIVPSKS